MSHDPLRPVLGGDKPFDATATEIESRAELDVHLAKGSLSGLTLLGPFFVKRGIDRGVMQTN